MKQWSWQRSAVALATVMVLAVVLVKPIGVSTQYVIADAMLWRALGPSVVELTDSPDGSKIQYSSSNPYLNKSGGKYAKAAAEPLNYGFIFVLAMVGGGFLGGLLSRRNGPRQPDRSTPRWQEAIRSPSLKRLAAVFAGGFLVLFGARLAGGCTSGHMMSGISQTALSGYLFAAAVFAAAVPAALLIYRHRGESQ